MRSAGSTSRSGTSAASSKACRSTRCWAGARRQRIEVYASLLQYDGSVELVRRNVARALERGYRQIKLHERTAETVAATREVTGPDIPIMVDTNCAWLPDEATAAVTAMAPSKPFWVEEPIWPPEDFAAMAKLRQATGVPLAAGENASGALDFRKMIEAGAADYVQPSVIKIGGITTLWRIATEAEADGVTCVPHAPFFGPGYLATLPRASPPSSATARSSGSSAISRTCRMARRCRSWTAASTCLNGPGLGADPDPELIALFASLINRQELNRRRCLARTTDLGPRPSRGAMSRCGRLIDLSAAPEKTIDAAHTKSLRADVFRPRQRLGIARGRPARG